MKNIFEIMKEYGVEIPADKQKEFEKAVLENYKTKADYDIQTEKLNKLNDTIKANDAAIGELKEKLKGFEGVDVSALNKRISDLEEEKKTIETDYQTKLADRDFSDVLKAAILDAKGKDVDKIIKLMDTETLKASKNQKEDVAAAVKALMEDDVTKGMFGETEPGTVKTGNIIGAVTGGGVDSADAQLRAVMGLLPVPNGTEQK